MNKRRFLRAGAWLVLHLTALCSSGLSGDNFIRGVDFSSVARIEAAGGVYKDNGVPTDPFSLIAAHGVNFVRIRTWHTPLNGENNLEETLDLAQRISDAGLGLILNFHYSDTWADPGHQTKPASWDGITFDALKDSIYGYTGDVITALRDQNTLPGIVQVGNEIICGMLWDDGRVCDSFDTLQQWSQLAELLDEGIRGVRDNTDPADSVKIMLHIDRGGDNAGSRWFFDNLPLSPDAYDLIGLSFYPWWHGTLDDLRFNLNDLAPRYGKPLVLIEGAYPWTLGWYDQTHNIVGEPGHLLQGYPASVEGQQAYLTDVMDIVRDVPEGMGIGFCYWGAELISAPLRGSVWENVTLFSFEGDVLPSISAFEPSTTSVSVPGQPERFLLLGNYPNPFNPQTTIDIRLPDDGHVALGICNQLGQQVVTLVDDWRPAGQHSVQWRSTNGNGIPVSAGVYYARLITTSGTALIPMVLLR